MLVVSLGMDFHACVGDSWLFTHYVSADYLSCSVLSGPRSVYLVKS